MNEGISDLNTNNRFDVNQSKSPNMNHNISSQDLNETNRTFKEEIEQKTGDKSLNEFQPSVSDKEKSHPTEKENTEKDPTNNENKKNLDETLKNLETSQTDLAELEKSKKNIEEGLGKIKSFKEEIDKADGNLKKFEKSWMIGKFVTGWKESTLAQKILTFLKIAVTVAISTALFVLSGGGLTIALLVASLSIGLLYYFAKDVVNIAKEKLTSALSNACREAIDFECRGIKNATEGITQTIEKIKTSLDGCKNDLGKQKEYIDDLKDQIETLENSIKEEIKNKDDQVNKQKEKIAEITKDFAGTIFSSLESSAEVEERAKNNISLVGEAEKEIALIKGACGEITKDSQEIKKLSDGITNQIKDFNRKTVDKLKKFAKENKIEISSEKIDDLEDKDSKRNLNKFYNRGNFSVEKSKGSNKFIKKLIAKIFSSNVDPTEFAKLLVEITKDQNEMNEEIKVSSQKISDLAEKINKEHVKKVQDFCTKIASTLATFKTNEQILLEMQKTYKKELISNFKKILTENFLKQEDTKKLEDLKEKFKNEKSFNKVFNFIFSEKESENQDFGEGEILVIKEIINELQQSEAKIENATRTTDILDILGNIETTIKSINDINDKCTKDISEIQNKDIKNIEDAANKINESIKNLQSFSKKLNVEIINKSAHIATASTGLIIGGTAVGLLGTTVGLPVTLVSGGAVLLGTTLYKVIEYYKNDKN